MKYNFRFEELKYDDGMGNWCEIETTELRELVEIWCNELKRFKKRNK